ncbi:MAG: response regulator, partial [Myxococcota bacterium]
MTQKILIIDDEPSVRESLKMALKNDFLVVTASTAEEGYKIVEEDPPDLLLLDIIMPGIDGLTALERIRAMNERIPVLMLTASQTRNTAFQAGRLGAYDYILKPFQIEDLRLKLADRRLPGVTCRL